MSFSISIHKILLTYSTINIKVLMMFPMSIASFCSSRTKQSLLLSAVAMLLYSSHAAAELVRGPYLQSATPESIIIQWRTDSAAPSKVAYGTVSSNLSLTIIQEAPTTEHSATLSGLVPETRYFYSVGTDTQVLGEGESFTFVTAPQKGSSRPTRIWVVGDSGGVASGYGDPISVRNAYYRFAGLWRTDIFLLLGDNAYESGSDIEYQAGFFDVYAGLLRQTAAWATIGNHDLDNYPIGGPWPYQDVFSFPTNAEAGGVASGTESYYSFEHGDIHFISLDSTLQNRATNGAMATWLKADLAANTSTWTVAFFHHAPYSMGSHNTDNAYEIQMTQMRENILPILEEGGVDLVLAGHSHNYERSYLLYGHYGRSTNLSSGMILDQGTGRDGETGPYVKLRSGPLANKGTVYVVSGNASECEPFKGQHPVMCSRSTRRGSFVLDVNQDRLEGTSLTDSGEVCDKFAMVKGPAAPLRICKLELQDGKTLLSWKSVRDKTYQVEMRHYGMSRWESAGSPVVATGATTFWTNSAPADASANFYRVMEQDPGTLTQPSAN